MIFHRCHLFSLAPSFNLAPAHPLKTPARFCGTGEARLSPAYLPSPLCSHITLTWLSIFSPPSLPPSARVFVCVCACVCALDLEQPDCVVPSQLWNPPRLPSNGTMKASRRALRVCLVSCKREAARTSASRGPSRLQLPVYCGWCIWRQLLTAFAGLWTSHQSMTKWWALCGNLITSNELSPSDSRWSEIQKMAMERAFTHFNWPWNNFKINFSNLQTAKHSHPDRHRPFLNPNESFFSTAANS